MSDNGLSPHRPDLCSVATVSHNGIDTGTVPHWNSRRQGGNVNLDDALAELLPNDRTGERQDDLVAAAVEAWRRRHVNTEAGAAVLAALADMGLSYRQIQQLTGIPPSTAHRWANPPDQDE